MHFQMLLTLCALMQCLGSGEHASGAGNISLAQTVLWERGWLRARHHSRCRLFSRASDLQRRLLCKAAILSSVKEELSVCLPQAPGGM